MKCHRAYLFQGPTLFLVQKYLLLVWALVWNLQLFGELSFWLVEPLMQIIAHSAEVPSK